MVFRKPYAFLIKYFKLINFILSALTIYIAYKSYSIINFFNEYISNNYSGNYYEGFYVEYISVFIYIILILMIMGILAIFILLTYKKKPAKLYLTSLIYVIIYVIFLVFIKNVMVTLETSVITAEAARNYRDIAILIFIPQIPLIISYFLRGLGFNTKKLNFESDIKELEISETDDEEVEFTLSNDNVKLKRNINRFIREFKYYVKENKFIFIVLCIGLSIALFFISYKSLPEIVDKNYNQGDNFTINSLNYQILDSIITNLDYKGDYIDEDYYFLVVKMSIENNTTKDVSLDYNSFRLILNGEYVYPILDKSAYFIDYAKDYYNDVIKRGSNDIYSLVYQIKEEDIKKNYDIKIANGSVFSDNLNIGRFNYVSISPIVINKVTTIASYKLGDEINFSNSNLGATKLKLSNLEITNRYIYEYEDCINDNCRKYKDVVDIDYKVNNTTLLVLDYTYEIDTTVPFYRNSSNINTFINNFMKVRYRENDEIKYAKVKDVTPKKLKDKIVLETTNKLLNSSSNEIAIIIRNKEYLIELK